MGGAVAPVLHVDAAALKDLVDGLPQLLADEGGDGLALLILVHHSVLFREKLLSLVEDVNDLHLSAHKIAFVLGAGGQTAPPLEFQYPSW